MPSESDRESEIHRPPAHQRGTDAGDPVLAALDFLRGGLPGDGETPGSPPLARQESRLLQWADSLGLLLNPSDLPHKVIRGGQEHELFHDEATDRYLKVTRNGVFGLSPGIELALVSSSQDARRFHLWEASPVEYLERLHLQNLLIPFDVIPCHPGGGFLAFIEETLNAGHRLRAVRTVTTRREL